jgi:hypothetical protein
MGEFGTVRRKVQKLQVALFSHFLCIFDHQGNPSLAEKKGEKHLKSSTFFSNVLVAGVVLKNWLSLAISTITDREINEL